MPPWPRVFLAAGLLVLTLNGCQSRPALTYRVEVSESVPRQLSVELRIADLVPGETTRLRSYAPPADSRVADLEAFDSGGKPVDIIAGKSGPDSAGTYSFKAPASGSVLIRYHVVLAGRQGEAHAGSQTRRKTGLNDHFGLMQGRDVFLVTDPPEAVPVARVSFHLPGGWSAWAPWAPSGAREATIEQRGRDELEEMVVAPIALGRFTPYRRAIGGTEFLFCVESSIPDSAGLAVVNDLEAGAREVARDLKNSLGSVYATMVVPPFADRDDLGGIASGSGQGATLYPLTLERFRNYTRRLLDAHLKYPPHQLEFRDPRDTWVAAGLREVLSLDVVSAVRHIPSDVADRYLTNKYAALPDNRPGALNLERVFIEPGADKEDREYAALTVAPLAIRSIERRLPGDGRQAMRSWLQESTRRGVVKSFWDEIPLVARDRTALRSAWAQGKAKLPIDLAADLSQIKPTPQHAPGVPVRSLCVALTSQMMGYLENCGCKVSQSGGLARRMSVVRALRRSDVPLLLVDLGSSLMDPGKDPDPDAFALAEGHLYQRVVASMQYAAAVPGYTDLGRGESAFDALREGIGPPYACANVRRRDGSRMAPASRVVTLAGQRCHVIGVYTPINPFRWASAFEEVLDSLELDDPVASVRAAVVGIPDRDLIVVAGEMSYRVVRDIINACPNIDLVLTCPQGFLGQLAPQTGDGINRYDVPGFINDTAVGYGDIGSYGVNTVRLDLTADGRITAAKFEARELDNTVPDDSAVRATLDNFYRSLSPMITADASVHSPAAVHASTSASYVGGNVCANCHLAETTQWKGTQHAGAMRTLTRVQRNTQPRCVACHTVGYGVAGGYRIGEATDERLVNVQCESCHGPGGDHVKDPRPTNIARTVPETTCIGCHDTEHSEAFSYAVKLPLVRHEAAVASAGRGTMAGEVRKGEEGP